MSAACAIHGYEHAIAGLYGKFGDDADTRGDYHQTEDARAEAPDTLSTVSARSRDRIEATAIASRQNGL